MIQVIFKTFKNELRRITRNRKLLMSLFVVPAVLVLFMTYLMELQKSTARICIAAEDQKTAQMIRSLWSEQYPINEEAVGRDILISVSDTITVVYDHTQIGARQLNEARRVATEIAAQLQGAEYAAAFRSGEPKLELQDIATTDELVKRNFMTILSFTTMMAVMAVGMNIITITADSIAGEKERGVYDGIVLSGAATTGWIIGKQLAVLLLASLIFAFSIVCGCAGNILMGTPMKEVLVAELNAGAVTELILSAIAGGLVFTALFSAISSGFGTIKNATSFCSIAMFAVSFLTMLPMLSDIPVLERIPFANFTGVCIRILTARSAMREVLSGLAVALVIYAVGTVVSVRIIKIQERRL